MEAPRVLIDTSIIIEHLRKQDRRKSILYRISNDFAFSTSTVVEFELYAGATDKQKRLDIGVVLNWFTVLPFTSDVANTAASLFQNLRVTNQQIEIRDIFIAATALTYNLSLMTLNAKHFERVDRLQLQSPPGVRG